MTINLQSKSDKPVMAWVEVKDYQTMMSFGIGKTIERSAVENIYGTDILNVRNLLAMDCYVAYFTDGTGIAFRPWSVWYSEETGGDTGQDHFIFTNEYLSVYPQKEERD